jgi:hypothetical protein
VIEESEAATGTENCASAPDLRAVSDRFGSWPLHCRIVSVSGRRAQIDRLVAE